MKILLTIILSSISITHFGVNSSFNPNRDKFNLVFNSMEITIDGKPVCAEELKDLNRLTVIAVATNNTELHEAISSLNYIIKENIFHGIDFILYTTATNFSDSAHKNAEPPYSYPVIYDRNGSLSNSNKHINLERLGYFIIDNDRNILASSTKMDKEFETKIEAFVSEFPLLKDSMIRGIQEKPVY